MGKWECANDREKISIFDAPMPQLPICLTDTPPDTFLRGHRAEYFLRGAGALRSASMHPTDFGNEPEYSCFSNLSRHSGLFSGVQWSVRLSATIFSADPV